MKKNKDPRFRLIILILVIMSVIIVREGFLVNEKLYAALLVTVPLLFYVLLRNGKKRVGERSSDYSVPAEQEKIRGIMG